MTGEGSRGPGHSSRLLRTGLAPGALAPDFDLPAAGGGRVRLSDYRGRQVLLVLSDSGCGPCRALAADLQRLHAPASGPAIVVVSHHAGAASSTPAGYDGLTYPVAVELGWQVNLDYGIFVTPCAFLIGEDGRIQGPAIVGREAILAVLGDGPTGAAAPAFMKAVASRREVLARAARWLGAAVVAAAAGGPQPAYAAGDYPLPAGSAADWRVRTDLGNQPCNPLNPAETAFSIINTPAGPGARLSSAASDCQCCACIGRSRTFKLPNPIVTDTATLKGYFSSSRGAGDPYSVGSFRVTLLVGTSSAGFKVFAAENRPNNNCTYPPGSEVVLGSGSQFEVSLKSIVAGATIDTIEIALQGYGCCQASNTVEVGGLRLNSPQLAGSTAPTTSPAATTPAQSTSGSPIAVIVIGAGVLILGGLAWFFGRRWLQPKPPQPVPVAPPVVPPTVEKKPPCDCGCSVIIEGQNDLGVCACQKVTYSLSQTGSTVAVLHATLPDGRELFARSYHAKLTPSCQGGATPGDATFAWSLGAGEKALTLGVTATMPYTCPGKGPASCTCVVENFQVALHEAPCIVSIINIEVGVFEVGHTAMQVTCGEFSTIYGFFAKDRENIAKDFMGQPGVVQTVSSSGTQDEIGKDYSGYYPTYNKKIWTLDVSCDKCDCLRQYWENLKANPGTYALLWWNCSSRVYDALIHCGLEIKGDESGSWAYPLIAEDRLDHARGEQADKEGRPITLSKATVIPAVQK